MTASPPRFCVVVRFTLRDGGLAAFLKLVQDNAAASVAAELACSRFDVLVSQEGDEVLLYELYADEAAFAEHLASPHFHAFDAMSAPLVVSKTVQRLWAHEHAK